MARAVFRSLRVLALLMLAARLAPGAESAAPQALEWNVFLSQWRVLGPLPKPDPSSNGTDVKFVEDEGALQPERAVEYQQKSYEWRAWDKPIVNFREALKAQGAAGDHVVGYAWTQFQSPKALKAVLALGHDDSIAAWLNGREVFRNDAARTACYLDQAVAEVDLKQGTNTLLLKIGQGAQSWEAIARLRPAGANQPFVSVACDRPVGGDLTRLPVLQLDLLGADGETLGAIRTSGFREQGPPQGLRFVAYATPFEATPAKVRFHYEARGLQPFDFTLSWADVAKGNVGIPLNASQRAAGRVVDANTGKPIAAARFWNGSQRTPTTTNQQGDFRLGSDLSPLATHRWVAAAGYEPMNVYVTWPRADNQVIKLAPGAQVLTGRVLSEDGAPLAKAKIEIGLYSGFTPHGITDNHGRFEIVGIPKDRKNLYPVITCPEYVAKDRFSVDLESDGVTEVEWKLARGAVVTGLVTAKTDGSPLVGVTVMAGYDRFGSNLENPDTKTDAQGRFRLSGVKPGETIVHAFSDQFAPAMQKLTVDAAHPAEAAFELEPGEAATGRVTDPSGKPIPDVWLVTDTWNGARMFQRETRTDAQGNFRMEHMPATAAEVHVIKTNYVSKRDLQVQGGEQYEVTLLPVVEHTARIRAVDTSAPPQDLQIHRGYLWSGRQDISWQSDSSDSDRNYDAATGVFKVRLSEPYDAEISYRFRAAGYRDAVITLPKNATEPKSWDLTLEKTATFRGSVVAADTGEPLEGVIVALATKEDRLRVDFYVQFKHPAEGMNEFTGPRSTTKADGSFELPRPENAAGTDLVLTKKDAGFVYLPRVADWLEQDRVEIPYPRHGAIQGTVTVAGEPAAGELVHAQWLASDGSESWDSPFGVGGQVTADANGRYQFTGLGPGRYRLSRVRSFDSPTGGGMSMYMEGEEVVLFPGETLTHDLARPAGFTVVGQTLDPRGRPLGDCLVTASRNSAELGRTERFDAVRADGDGRFTFHHLPAGNWELSADHYSVTDGQRCGLGGQDYGGAEQLRVSADAKVTIKLQSRLGGALAEGASLAGSIPPDFTGKPQGAQQEFTLSGQWGKVVVIDFWATWCGPCMAAMPQFKALHEKYKGRDDVVFLTVSLDQDAEQLQAVIKEQGLVFPVIYSGQGWEDAIAKSFGVTGIPSTFVIGRDGRFAANELSAATLGEAIEAALHKSLDPAYAAGKKPARLTVKVNLDETGLGAPGARLALRALDAQGKTVREDELVMPGVSNQIVWLYPPLGEGGRLLAALRFEGAEEQQQTVQSPSAQEALTFALASPRTVAGRVTADDGRTPAPGVKVILHGKNGFTRSGVADQRGEFRIKTLPGKYVVAVEGTEQFAPLARRSLSVSVAAQSDPDPLSVEVCSTVTVQGVVYDQKGAPVVGAKVRSGASDRTVETDENGRFALAGVASQGNATLYASKDKVAGGLQLTDFDGKSPQKITLGEGLGSSARGLSRGSDAPPLTAQTLEGELLDWQPEGERDHLVVFCALWHPSGRALLAKAQTWADEHKTTLDVFSIDWSADQVRRELTLRPVKARVMFAGPAGLVNAKAWSLTPPGNAYLVSSQGKILSVPAAGALP